MSTEPGINNDITNNNEIIQSRRLELSLRPEDGSLLTAPLLHVLLSSTDRLYNDFYNMIQGEIDVSVAVHNTSGASTITNNNTDSQTSDQQQQDDDLNGNSSAMQQQQQLITVQTKKEKMSKLSFAERRNELGWRLASNAKCIQHVAALCAAAAYNTVQDTTTTNNNTVTSLLAHGTAVSTKALQHTRTAWVQADEAQDALYFFHAQLFPLRLPPHDVYGATDLICTGTWYDLPRDLLLSIDKYHTSIENEWNKTITSSRWHLAVRDKLVTGEVGWYKQQKLKKQIQRLKKQPQQQGETRRYDHDDSNGINDENDINDDDKNLKWKEPLWRVSLKGGVVNLTHGKPKYVSVEDSNEKDDDKVLSSSSSRENNNNDSNNTNYNKKLMYPIDALVTVYPNIQYPNLSQWTLLSINVHVQAKTGEFNHQLEATNRQRYDLHRLASLAMSREEAIIRRQRIQQQEQEQQLNSTSSTTSTNTNDMHTTNKTPITKNDDYNDNNMDTTDTTNEQQVPARPLQALFQVVHIFSLSWQLELLSAQAQALRRGVWSAATENAGVGPNNTINNNNTISNSSSSNSNSNNTGSNLVQVTPVRFFNHPTAVTSTTVLGVVSISFWKVDDTYGSPSMCDISLVDNEQDENDEHVNKDDHNNGNNLPAASTIYKNTSPNQLQLSIRAEVDVGICISLSGGGQIMNELKQGRSNFFGNNQTNTVSNEQYFLYKQLQTSVEELIENASNPFALSASDALLAATKLCCELKCRAVVAALQPKENNTSTNTAILPSTNGVRTLEVLNRPGISSSTGSSISKFQLPSWIKLSVNRGTISVAAQIRYHGINDCDTTTENTKFPILFQLVCDARTGSFVCTFPRSMNTLRKLTGHDVYNASEPMAIRLLHLPESRRRTAMSSSGGVATTQSVTTNRVVRDAFDGLIRSMNLLGQRTGVGGTWDDNDDQSSHLRDRAISLACADAESSLIKCCGIAAMYGLSPLAFNAATGLDAIPDMAGDAIENFDGYKFLNATPISILLDQQLLEMSNEHSTSDVARKKVTYIEQSLLAIGCTVDKTVPLTMFPFHITVKLDSITSTPQREECTALSFVFPNRDEIARSAYARNGGPDLNGNDLANGNCSTSRPLKRQRFEGQAASSEMVEVMVEVSTFAEIIATTLETAMQDTDIETINL